MGSRWVGGWEGAKEERERTIIKIHQIRQTAVLCGQTDGTAGAPANGCKAVEVDHRGTFSCT